MNFDKIIVKINVKTRELDYNHPLNMYSISSTSGTGFFISIKPTLILTCYHVVKNAVNIEIINKQNDIYTAKIIYIYPDDDLAVLKVDKIIEDIEILKFKFIKNKENLKVYAVGFPLGSNNIIKTKGIISGFTNSYIQVDTTVNEGNSGGPLLIKNKKKKTYNVIGVIVSKFIGDNIENTNFAIPIYRFYITIDYLINNPKVNIIKKPLIRFEIPIETFKYQKIYQNQLKLNYFPKNINNYDKYINSKIGILITKISDNFYFNKYLKVNDILLTINGNEISNLGDCKFDFYPETININNIGYWFVEKDIIELEFINSITKNIEKIKFPLEIFKMNIYEYYSINNKNYYFVNNNFILSIITNEHFNNDKFKLSGNQYFNLINRCKKNIFTVILSDIIQDDFNNFNNYPINDIILSINNKEFNNYSEFLKIIENESIVEFKTINNNIYYHHNYKVNLLTLKN